MKISPLCQLTWQSSSAHNPSITAGHGQHTQKHPHKLQQFQITILLSGKKQRITKSRGGSTAGGDNSLL